MKKDLLNKIARYAGLFALLIAFSATLTSCVVHTPSSHRNERKGIPPGQHKKMHGDRSAKRYAPGQQKKQHKKSNKHHNDNKGNNKHKRGR